MVIDFSTPWCTGEQRSASSSTRYSAVVVRNPSTGMGSRGKKEMPTNRRAVHPIDEASSAAITRSTIGRPRSLLYVPRAITSDVHYKQYNNQYSKTKKETPEYSVYREKENPTSVTTQHTKQQNKTHTQAQTYLTIKGLAEPLFQPVYDVIFLRPMVLRGKRLSQKLHRAGMRHMSRMQRGRNLRLGAPPSGAHHSGGIAATASVTTWQLPAAPT